MSHTLITRGEVIARLRSIGFTATAYDLESGRISYPEVVRRLRRDAPKFTDGAPVLRLADDIENGSA